MDNELKLKLKKAIFDGFTNYKTSGDMHDLHGMIDYISNSVIDVLIAYTPSREVVTASLCDDELLGFICNKLCTLLDFENCCTWNKTVVKKRFTFNFNIYTGNTLNTCMFCSSTYNISDESSTDNLCTKCAVEYSKIAEIETITNKFLTYCKDEHFERCDDGFYSSYSKEETLDRTKVLINSMLKYINDILLIEPLYPYNYRLNNALSELETLLRKHLSNCKNISFYMTEDSLMDSLIKGEDTCVFDRDVFIMLSPNKVKQLTYPRSGEYATVIYVDKKEFVYDAVCSAVVRSSDKSNRVEVYQSIGDLDLLNIDLSGIDTVVFNVETQSDYISFNRMLTIIRWFSQENPALKIYFLVDCVFKDTTNTGCLKALTII